MLSNADAAANRRSSAFGNIRRLFPSFTPLAKRQGEPHGIISVGQPSPPRCRVSRHTAGEPHGIISVSRRSAFRYRVCVRHNAGWLPVLPVAPRLSHSIFFVSSQSPSPPRRAPQRGLPPRARSDLRFFRPPSGKTPPGKRP